ncbi:MAG: hypothetical protein HDS83_04995 [Bacteroidales bacterium]|nr:hypothetical protein [Bacteroidales bacterium]
MEQQNALIKNKIVDKIEKIKCKNNMLTDCIKNILLFDEDNIFCSNLLLKIIFDESFQDWKWKQDLCIEIAKSMKNPDLCGLAVTCLGHIARIHNKIEKNKVVQELDSIKDKTYISCRIEDALDDINMFTK